MGARVSSHQSLSIAFSAFCCGLLPPSAAFPTVSSTSFASQLERQALSEGLQDPGTCLWLVQTARASRRSLEGRALQNTSAENRSDFAEALLQMARSAADLDRDDGSVILFCVVIFAALYLLAGCLMAQTQSGREVEERRSLAERIEASETLRWALPRMGIRHSPLPAICGTMLGHTRDTPVQIHLGHLEEFGTSSCSTKTFDILSCRGERVLTARLLDSLETLDPTPLLIPLPAKRLQIIGKGVTGQDNFILAAMSPDMVIWKPTGQEFGRLVKAPGSHDEYELQESDTGRHRWVVSANSEEGSFQIFWRPRNRILATAKRSGSKEDYLKVSNTDGVDMVLVLLCVLGLLAYELNPQPHEIAKKREELVQLYLAAPVGGSARNLLESIPRTS